jgi:hypothetical protein
MVIENQVFARILPWFNIQPEFAHEMDLLRRKKSGYWLTQFFICLFLLNIFCIWSTDLIAEVAESGGASIPATAILARPVLELMDKVEEVLLLRDAHN